MWKGEAIQGVNQSTTDVCVNYYGKTPSYN